MAIQTFLVTVDLDKIASGAIEATDINIKDLLAKVPTARIVSGDPTVAVRVRVDERQQEKLKAAVGKFCVIGPYKDLHLFSPA
jgi:hypothetical protein